MIFPWLTKSFLWLFLSFHQDILVKETRVTLVYANIAIA